MGSVAMSNIHQIVNDAATRRFNNLKQHRVREMGTNDHQPRYNLLLLG